MISQVSKDKEKFKEKDKTPKGTEEELTQVMGEPVDEPGLGEEPAGEEKPSDGKEEIEKLKKANAELSDKVLRQIAEFDNFRKRSAREKDEIGLVVKSKVLTEMLPVVDNFERAMGADCADPDFKKGMEMIFKALWDAMVKQGVEEIKAEGEPFNPDFHYAVSTVEDEGAAANTVATVLQKGYKLGDKVLRHAMVAVANP